MTEIDERECGVGEKKRCIWERRRVYMEPPPALTNYLSNKVALTTKKWRKVWAKWDGREEEHELARWGGEGKKKTQWGVR